MIWHVQQNVIKCFIIPLPRFSYIYTDLFTLRERKKWYNNREFRLRNRTSLYELAREVNEFYDYTFKKYPFDYIF